MHSSIALVSDIQAKGILSNGRLQAALKYGMSQDHFNRDLMLALSNSSTTTPSISTTIADDSGSTPQRSYDRSPGPNPNIAANAQVQSIFEERRRRLEADRNHKNEAEKAERKAKAEARRIEVETAALDSSHAKQASYARLQKKRQQEARQERERILRIIDNDKAERRVRDELRKALKRAQESGNDGAGGLVDSQIFNELDQSNSKDQRHCTLQIRLFDGSSIRAKFSPDHTLQADVRAWIADERTDGDNPYKFKQILTLMPNRSITISEEEESLHALGLTPNATLVMIPVQDHNSESGLISRSYNYGYAIASGGVGFLTEALGTFLGVSRRGQSSVQYERRREASSTTTRTNMQGSENTAQIRALGDQPVDRDRQQFYNGNEVSGCLDLQ